MAANNQGLKGRPNRQIPPDKAPWLWQHLWSAGAWPVGSLEVAQCSPRLWVSVPHRVSEAVTPQCLSEWERVTVELLQRVNIHTTYWKASLFQSLSSVTQEEVSLRAEDVFAHVEQINSQIFEQQGLLIMYCGSENNKGFLHLELWQRHSLAQHKLSPTTIFH